MLLRAIALLALLAACGSDPKQQDCTPGETQACLVAGGGSGVQTCSSDGSGFGSCMICRPFDLIACKKLDGSSGTQSCETDGSGYTACS